MFAARRIVLTTIVENYIDMLLPDQENVSHLGLIHHFDPKKVRPQAENGISILAEIYGDRELPYRVLFDAGLSPAVLLNNMKALGIEPWELDHIVISHGHPDHYGGLMGLLEQVGHPVPVSIHPDAFLPRYLRLRAGEVAPYYNHEFTESGITDRGGRIVPTVGALEVGAAVWATGQIERVTEFEQLHAPQPEDNALLQVRGGCVEHDHVYDDQALVINLRGKGLVVLAGCSHAGIVNTIVQAQKTTGIGHVYAVLGGFHLGFPGVPFSKTEKTIEVFTDMAIDVVCPMHCTGLRAIAEMARSLPEAYILNCSTTRLVLDGNGARVA
jgi:7,8-dihydropterin-6-yl-methyl-4-(beta-D-ribofuranosyl)aminobenzene 5'-phosphate synthase